MANLPRRRLVTLLDGLGDLSASDEPEIDGAVRDEISHVRHAIYEILDRREDGHG